MPEPASHVVLQGMHEWEVWGVFASREAAIAEMRRLMRLSRWVSCWLYRGRHGHPVPFVFRVECSPSREFVTVRLLDGEDAPVALDTPVRRRCGRNGWGGWKVVVYVQETSPGRAVERAHRLMHEASAVELT